MEFKEIVNPIAPQTFDGRARNTTHRAYERILSLIWEILKVNPPADDLLFTHAHFL